ncbi:hypothetical protein ACS0PU_011519 [Formica fusca]
MRFQQLFLNCLEVKYPLELRESQGKKLDTERLVKEGNDVTKKKEKRKKNKKIGEKNIEVTKDCDTTVSIHVLRTVRRMSVETGLQLLYVIPDASRNWVFMRFSTI